MVKKESELNGTARVFVENLLTNSECSQLLQLQVINALEFLYMHMFCSEVS